jgi:hypothetical protein
MDEKQKVIAENSPSKDMSANGSKQPTTAAEITEDDEAFRESLPQHQRIEDRQPTPPIPSPVASMKKTENNRANMSKDTQWQLKDFRMGLFDTGKRDLFYTLTRRNYSDQPKVAVLNVATLQYLALRDAQHSIATYVAEMYEKSEYLCELDGQPPLTELLAKYSDTVRNIDFMTQCALRGYDEDPFIMKSSRALERGAMEKAGLIPEHVLPAGQLPVPYDHNRPQLKRGRNETNRAAEKKKRLLRFSMAAMGGLLLLVPVIIMATVPGLVASLVTTCVATLVFALLIAWRTDLGPNEVLATTAAYAAVLVVFVGTSLGPPGGASGQ